MDFYFKCDAVFCSYVFSYRNSDSNKCNYICDIKRINSNIRSDI